MALNLTGNESDKITESISDASYVLTSEKTASIELASSGTSFSYALTVTNIGGGTAPGVTVEDIADSCLEIDPNRDISPQPDSSRKLDDGSTLYSWKIGDLPPGKIKISIRAEVADKLSSSKTSIVNKYRAFSGSSPVNQSFRTLEIPLMGNGIWIEKKADASQCSPGEDLTYTISYGNNFTLDAKDVVVADMLPDVEYIDSDPQPSQFDGETLIWRIGDLAPGRSGKIAIKVKVPERPEIAFDESTSVIGQGFVSIDRSLSTSREGQSLVNRANITCHYSKGHTSLEEIEEDSSEVEIGKAKTKIETSEHGSGYYQKKLTSSQDSKQKSVSLEDEIYARHGNATKHLPGDRKITYKSLWSGTTNAENEVRNESLCEEYRYMEMIDKKSSFKVDQNQTIYSTDANFSAGAMTTIYAGSKASSTAEVSEEYHGSFRVKQSLDSYGSGVTYTKSVKGSGYASSEKRMGNLEGSFEHGSGLYQSEERLNPQSVHKDSKMAYLSANLRAGSLEVNVSSRWHEGVYVFDPSLNSYISERISQASYIDKSTMAGPSSLETSGELQGVSRIKAVRDDGSWSNRSAEIDQIMAGSFKLYTSVNFVRSTTSLGAHINLTKEVIKISDDEYLFFINLTNDGNRTLGPVEVTDQMPYGLEFTGSSFRPELKGQTVIWSIDSLGIGRSESIELWTRRNCTADDFTNIARASARYDNGTVSDEASVRFSPSWLPCCSSYSVRPAGQLNAQDNASTGQDSCQKFSSGEWTPSPCFGLQLSPSECLPGEGCNCSETECASCLIDELYSLNQSEGEALIAP